MWQPIETAPRDGSAFLVWLDKPMLGSNIHTWSRRTERLSGCIGCLMAYDVAEKPTHWMPLPEPPKS